MRSPRSPPPCTPCLTCTDTCITADALHTQREHATYLRSRGAHYLLTVKGNQPTLHRRIAALPWAQVPLTRARQRGHGRAESHTCQVLTLP